MEHSHLCLAIRLGRRCMAKDLVAVFEELTSLYSALAFVRSDNVPEFIAHALRRWCKDSDTATAYIVPCSPGIMALLNPSTVGSGMNTQH